MKNDYKKYEGIKANRLKDENKFKDQIEAHIKNNKPFLFGCDSCSVVEEYFYYFFDKYPQLQNKFVLFTANHKFNITDANEQFKDMFVFFSPAITTAVDFNIEKSQDVFIFIRGKTILPSGSFQQTTRTRNINELYYFCNVEPKDQKYESLEEVKEEYNKMYGPFFSYKAACDQYDEIELEAYDGVGTVTIEDRVIGVVKEKFLEERITVDYSYNEIDESKFYNKSK